ncbi:MAG TPA: acyl-homoserine-lactone synthase [Dongiaceae bacterium]|jgi:acyl homoserine lactone synthase|nr:acyl-homoserine-lactone synthase [Dongiaceae bacterium]
MIEIVTWKNVHLHGSLWADHHRLRYKLFIERLRWQVNSEEGMEYDEFDTPAATYLFVIHKSRLASVARFIPTTKPYMIEKLWPFFMESLPRDNTVWELSRFGVDPDLSTEERTHVSLEAILGFHEFGLRKGIERVLVVMPTQLIRHLTRMGGCSYSYLSPPRMMDGMRIAAAAIDVSADVASRLRYRLMDYQSQKIAA